MPTNKAIYVAILVIAASALLYLGMLLTTAIAPILPWTTGFGILLLIGAVLYEAQAKKDASANQDKRL